MNDSGWRTFILTGKCDLSYRDGCLVSEDEEGEHITPISDLRQVMVMCDSKISINLLNALSENDVSVILCDKKFRPSCELTPYNRHTQAAGNLMEQIAWKDYDKEIAWQHVVQNKMLNQRDVLKTLDKDVPIMFRTYLLSLKPGDKTNREGQAARVYFNALFGKDFTRQSDDELNSILNYGYAILLSACSRAVALHGYNNALGIHHCSRVNPFNLACDLMEPFRPFVDELAYKRRGLPLDWSLKKELIALPYSNCVYNKKQTKIYTAIEQYAASVLRFMKGQEQIIGEVSLCQSEKE